MKTTDFSNASAAFVDMNQLLNVEKKYADLFRKRKNKANAKGRMRRVQTIFIECNGRIVEKQIKEPDHSRAYCLCSPLLPKPYTQL